MKILHRVGIVSLIIFALAEASTRAGAADLFYIVGVQHYLQVHSSPGEDSRVLLRIPLAVSEIKGYSSSIVTVDGQDWMLIEWRGIKGFVNRSYLQKE